MWHEINDSISELCHSPFWDVNLTWNSADPDFTPCFENTALVWIPCSFLWLFLPLETYYRGRSIVSSIPFNSFNVLKLLMIIILILFASGKFIFLDNHSPVDFYSSLIRIFTFCLCFVLTLANIKCGIRSSGTLFFFSFLLILCGAPQLRTEFRSWNSLSLHGELDKNEIDNVVRFTWYFFYYLATFILFVLNCFSDKYPVGQIFLQNENLCPEKQSSFLSKFVFAWFDKFAWKGYRKVLDYDDLWNLDDEMQTTQIVEEFEKNWRLARRCVRQISTRNCEVDPENENLLQDETSSNDGAMEYVKEASLVGALWRTFRSHYFLGAFFRLIFSSFALSGPLLLNWIIEFVDNREEFLWRGYLYAIMLLLVTLTRTLSLNQYFHITYRIGLRIRSALVAVIYKKSLTLSNGARTNFTVGEITNFMSVDVERIPNLMVYISLLWCAPLEITVTLYFLYDILGPSAFLGLTILMFIVPFNVFIISKMKTLQNKQMQRKDERIKLTNEILSGIRVLKLYSWEPSFQKQIMKTRLKEMDIIKCMAYYEAGDNFITVFAPILVSIVTLATYVLSSDEHVLDARVAFVSLSLFNSLRAPLGQLPWMITELNRVLVSLNRIHRFLLCEELDSNAVSHNPSDEQITIENGQFSWESKNGASTLKNINLKVNPGDLIGVVGAVASGKSSLLCAILGEMYKQSGQVNSTGTLAYVPQQAWIQNSTFKENITFGQDTEGSSYDEIVKACALKPDLEILPARDQTEIGEKGVNLSGGQKQRISLARAIFANADTYLLDDPLSAVDSHVGKHIFKHVIGPEGLLKEKTRILVTHNVTYLPQVDYIIVLKDGTISEEGTYKELVEKKGDFSAFLVTHAEEVIHKDPSEIEKHENNVFPNSLSESRVSCLMASSESLKTRNSNSESNDDAIIVEEMDKRRLIETEDSEEGNVKLDVYKYYVRAMGSVYAALTILLNFSHQGLIVASGYWLSVWSNNMSKNDDPNRKINEYYYLSVYAFLGLGQAGNLLVQTIVLYMGALKASMSIHNHLLAAVLHWPALVFDKLPTGRILNRFNSDVNILDRTLMEIIMQFLYCTAVVMSTLYVITYSTPIFVIVIVPLTILYYVIQRFFIATSRQLRRLTSASKSPMYSHFGESISGAQSIRAYNLQSKFIEVSASKVDVNLKCAYLNFVANRWLSVRLESIGSIVTFTSALFAVLARNTLSAGLVGLSVSYAIQITNTMYLWVRMIAEMETNIVAVERLKTYIEKEQEAPWVMPSENVPENWPDRGEIVFQDLEVRYNANLEPVLKGISFTVSSGQRVGIVGRTGAGKSSLTLSLFRIIEASDGKILIDGVDVAKIGLRTLRERLTIIPQDPVLFTGTLRMNLDPTETYSDERLWRALELVNLKTYVSKIDSGLQHVIQEGGSNFSVGQRQLICLARAVLRKTKILILDEATASVDMETDDMIQQTIRKEFKGCTVLTIAHRLETIRDYDRIVVLDKGVIVEYDAPNKLLDSSHSVFYKMALDAGLSV